MSDPKDKKMDFSGCCPGGNFKFPGDMDEEMSEMMKSCCGEGGSFDCSAMMEMFKDEDGSFDVDKVMKVMRQMMPREK